MKSESNLTYFSLGSPSTNSIGRPVAPLLRIRTSNEGNISNANILTRNEELSNDMTGSSGTSPGNLGISSYLFTSQGTSSLQESNINYNCDRDIPLSSCTKCIDWSFLEKLYNHSFDKSLVDNARNMIAKHSNSDEYYSKWKISEDLESNHKVYIPKEKRSSKESKIRQSSVRTGGHKACPELRKHSAQRVQRKGSAKRKCPLNGFAKGMPLRNNTKTGRKSLTKNPSE